jgi:transglutaminase-like putative cysteine protease
MKKTLTTLCLFIGLCIPIVAQNIVREFGKYTGEEFKMGKYDKDPSAEAVAMYDIGSSYFIFYDNGYQVVFERRTKIKIFNSAGLKYAQMEIPYYQKDNKNEKVIELEGNTYNYENGIIRKTPLDEKNTYNEKINEHWLVKKFAMPDVKVGSIIEVKYKIISPYFFNFRSWEFQKKIPVIYSEYVTKMIPFYEYTYKLQGASKLDCYNHYEEKGNQQSLGTIKFNNMIYEFIMRDVQAFKDEAYITSMEDYILKLDFQLAAFHSPSGGDEQIMTTWPKLIDDMLEDESFGKYLQACKRNSEEIVEAMKMTNKTGLEKAACIDKYLKSNYYWNGNYSKRSTKSAKNFLKTKTGNSADINLLYVALLNAAGIESYPVLISTRDNGKIKYDYPFQQFFNDVIVTAKINEANVLLDATEPLSSFRLIPSECLNDKGLVVKKDKEKYVWLNIKSSVDSDISYQIDLNPNVEKDSVDCGFISQSTGYDAVNLRKKFLKNPKEFRISLSINNMILKDSIKAENLHEIDQPFESRFGTAYSLDRIEDKRLISPFCNLIITENPFKKEVRTYPIDMVYRHSRSYSAIVHVPNGYKILSLPENMDIDNNEVRIQYQAENTNDGTIKITGIYQFKKDVYDPSSFTELKGYFNKIIDKFNEKVVFSKVNP